MRDEALDVIHVTDGARWAGTEAHLLNLLLAANADSRIRLTVAVTVDGEPAERFRLAGGRVVILEGGYVRKILMLRERLRSGGYDFVHTHGYLGSILGVLASLNMPIHVVTTLHGALEPGEGPTTRIWWYSRTAKWLLALRRARCIAVSEKIAQTWQQHGVSRTRLTVIHNGIESRGPPKASPEARGHGPVSGQNFCIGMIGRLVPVKDPILFLRIASAVTSVRSDVRFLIVGDGPMRPLVEEESTRGILDGRVSLLGFRSDASELAAGLDLVLFSSESEGIPYALLESMAAGVPTVAPAVGGLPEVLSHGVNALVCGDRSVESLAAAVIRFLEEGSLRTKLSEGSIELAEGSFSAHQMLNRVVSFYRDVGR